MEKKLEEYLKDEIALEEGEKKKFGKKVRFKCIYFYQTQIIENNYSVNLVHNTSSLEQNPNI